MAGEYTVYQPGRQIIVLSIAAWLVNILFSISARSVKKSFWRKLRLVIISNIGVKRS